MSETMLKRSRTRVLSCENNQHRAPFPPRIVIGPAPGTPVRLPRTELGSQLAQRLARRRARPPRSSHSSINQCPRVLSRASSLSRLTTELGSGLRPARGGQSGRTMPPSSPTSSRPPRRTFRSAPRPCPRSSQTSSRNWQKQGWEAGRRVWPRCARRASLRPGSGAFLFASSSVFEEKELIGG
jgi:hypothetical protein